ncbi:hypothetical protein HYH02_015056 [Chlamydomonas schloesseri]|uniref:Uncharacterized protein n=1 Tax=Chlamydomonas schloesseri TaxID=2026947 RepID=A0A835SE04_9CHLO|nr:hypothetical protein HYH02_015056 [Chlamydomonas schloesseri]|eukprot:KAG2425229.1 hypothetical protein HYH02_015056 [Chlamydomonas schloesseri]
MVYRCFGVGGGQVTAVKTGTFRVGSTTVTVPASHVLGNGVFVAIHLGMGGLACDGTQQLPGSYQLTGGGPLVTAVKTGTFRVGSTTVTVPASHVLGNGVFVAIHLGMGGLACDGTQQLPGSYQLTGGGPLVS